MDHRAAARHAILFPVVSRAVLHADQLDRAEQGEAQHPLRVALGDITDGNTPAEWERTRDALGNLDGHVPYAVVMGNHDYSGSRKGSTDRDSPMNRYFPVSQFNGQPTFGGVIKAGHVENAYYLFSAAAAIG